MISQLLVLNLSKLLVVATFNINHENSERNTGIRALIFEWTDTRIQIPSMPMSKLHAAAWDNNY